MKLTWLANEFRRAGLRVVEEPGWEDRGAHWRTGRPFGAIQHHTAAPVPFNVRALTTPLIKCNFNVKPDGTVHVIAAGSCDFSSGSGSQVVLDEVRRDVSPTGTAKARGLLENVSGNPLFINNETDHLGKGQPIPDVQYHVVIECWVVIFEGMGWHPNRLIGHGEWRSRKRDPAWNDKNSHNNMEDMRADLAAALAGERPPPIITEEDHTMLPLHFSDGFNDPTGQGRTRKRDDVKVLQAMLGFSDDDIDGKYGEETVLKVKAVVGGNGKTVDGNAYIRIQEAYLQSFLRSSDNG